MANHHPSPTMMQLQHRGQEPPGPAPQARQFPAAPPSQQITAVTEAVWMQIGRLAEALGTQEEAMGAYESALRANPQSVQAMMAIALILRTREEHQKAIEFLQAVIKLDPTNGEAYGSLGHCYLMMEDLRPAYDAYQSAISNLRDPKEPKLWYGIGILYDRFGSHDLAEEAFYQVMQMCPNFEKANEIYFRLGIIYKAQQKYNRSLECFQYIVNTPPAPLTETDIWFQIGHVYEVQKDYDNSRAAYLRVLERDPNHAQVLQQLGWLHHNQSSSFQSQERAIEYLEKSVNADSNEATSWYLLGRCYMAQQKYNKAYESYQQAVYRDGRNPTFWCSIGVLYYQINQYRDALDAYSRAIRLNPYISEVWYDLGTLYESCNNQVGDAIDAYSRAAELDPTNVHIKARLQLLRNGPAQGPAAGGAPQPTDVQIYNPGQGPTGPPTPAWAGQHPQAQQAQAQPSQQGQHPPPPPPPAGPPAHGWGHNGEVNPGPQPRNPYESQHHQQQQPQQQQQQPQQQQRPADPYARGPAPAPQQVPPIRQPSPRQEEQMRPPQHQQYNDLHRIDPNDPRGPVPIQRGPSPRQNHYAQQGPPPTSQPLHNSGRILNQGYVPRHIQDNGGPSSEPPKPPSQYPPRNSPRPDGRQIHDNRMPSPKSAYPQHQQPPPTGYGHPPPEAGPLPGPMEATSHPSQPPMQSDAAMQQRMDDRPPSVGPKRRMEWEEESVAKKQANEENRARLEDMRHRRPSPERDHGPREYRRSSSESRRMEEQRRADEQRRHEDMRRAEDQQRLEQQQRHANEGYHPSEAAHHPPSHPMPPAHLPPMQQGPGPIPSMMHEQNGPPPPPQSERPKAEDANAQAQTAAAATAAMARHAAQSQSQAAVHEPERAARKVEVDEDYDEPDDKKAVVTSANGSGPAGATSEMKTTTPTSATINGVMKKEGP